MNNSNIEQLVDTMMQLGKLMSRQQQDCHKERVATMLQFSVLRLLKDRSDVKIGDVSGSLKISKSSATQLIERLAKAGFVKKIRATNDRRVIHLAITQRGEKELFNLREQKITKMSKFLSKIPDKDITDLIRINKNLINALKKGIL
jgi:DNA-binding MarR family transcriptional regulator